MAAIDGTDRLLGIVRREEDTATSLFEFEQDDLVNSVKAAVEANCLSSYLEILDSEQFKQKFYARGKATRFLLEVDVTPLLDQIQSDLPLLQGRVSKEAFGTLFAVSAKAGRLILPPEQFDQVSTGDLRRALQLAIGSKHTNIALEIIFSTEIQKVFSEFDEYLPNLFTTLCAKMPETPSLVRGLCALLTAERMAHISKEHLELFISTVSHCWHLEEDCFPLFLEVFVKVVESRRFREVSSQVIQDSFVAATRSSHSNRDAMIQAFVNCGRFQEIRMDTLFSSLGLNCFFSGLRSLEFADRPIVSLEDALCLLCPFGAIWPSDGSSAYFTRDVQRILRQVYPVVCQVDSFIALFDFKQIFVKDPDCPYNVNLERVLIAAAGLGLQHIVHSILSCRLKDIRPFAFEKAVYYSLSCRQIRTFTYGQADRIIGFIPQDLSFDLARKSAITEEMLFSPESKDVPLNLVGLISTLVDRGDFDLIERVLESDRFKALLPTQRA